MKAVSVEEAVARIPNGATVMVGGFMGVGTPERLLDELVRQRKSELSIISNDAAVPGKGVGKLFDASLVSMLTVVELTKQTQIFATNIGSWVIPGLLCALLYLAMSLPLGYLARRLEERWRMPTV